MRIALISDLHANFVALEAVLADAARAGYDRLICLGDVASFGPQPRETVGRLRELGCVTIQGNHDPFHADPNPLLAELDAWTVAELSGDEQAWLAGLPADLEVELGDAARLLCVHGSPRSYDEQVLAHTPAEDLDQMIEGRSFEVMVCGHTHVQLLRWHRSRALVNVGSVGMPFVEAFLPGGPPPRSRRSCEYAQIEWDRGHLRVELRAVPLDWKAHEAATRASSMPHQERFLDQWLGA